MKKLIAALLLLGALEAPAQTFFYYGRDSVSLPEFLAAYEKNNAAGRSEKSFREYLDLYIASRLKIAEARRLGYDTLPQLVADLQGLRQQILPAYMVDRESLQRMAAEAAERAQKDIRLAHIFIATPPQGDTAPAYRKAMEAYRKLATTPFAAVATEFSGDPSVKENGGDVGFVTVFSLPYTLENALYALRPGQHSGLIRTKAGYHIVKNMAERKALGRMKAAQILLAFPPDATAEVKASIKNRADSIYSRLLKGDAFGTLAAAFSNDVISSVNAGQMQEFGVGDYDPKFEAAVFALPSNGALTKPFLTAHGYHIVKRLERIPPPKKGDEEAMALLRAKVEGSDRMLTTRHALVQQVMKTAGYRQHPFSEGDLWAYSDSIFLNRKNGRQLSLNSQTPLLQLGSQSSRVADWLSFAQTFRYKTDGSGIKPYGQVWQEFIEATAIDYYQQHLEEYNEAFRQQLAEFRDGNLFFEIMQRQVWGPAQADSAALLAYYGNNRSRYVWKPSADAVLFYASDMAAAKTFIADLKQHPARWQELVTDMNEKIAADSARFELTQLPNGSNAVLREGLITEPKGSTSDNSASFAYIIKLYPGTTPRSYADAKGLVINDYQAEVEGRWMQELRAKYPVKVNTALLEEMIRKKKY